jgi:hypothetical protein
LSFHTDTERGSSRIEVGKDGEGTPTTTAIGLLITTDEEAPAVRVEINKEVK